MANFRFKTTGDASPQGKPRVYYTAHPADHARFFEEITNDILSKQNCAVFYLDPDDGDDIDGSYELDLSQMQLFVVPVTSALLTQPNRAMDTDIPIAQRNNIPILPLMQESGSELTDRFNSRFGDLQYLDKNAYDPTALSFDEKLRRFLSSVIIGDELAEKVRNAFDAYVFLSYRKKDREQANRLMRIIHDTPEYRDIAIWYDEFLVPGENFNDAIQDAFEKSSVFALTVTPNLLEEGNYVMTTEYRLADRRRKEAERSGDADRNLAIVPVEMYDPNDRNTRTDMGALAANYPDIGEVQDEHDKPRTSAAFIEALSRVAKKENDGSALHRYFIGLAYLSGIDVEVNHERAESLLTGSAEDGCTEAMRKLGDMYANGEGVKRSILESVKWRERLAGTLEKEYGEKGGKENAWALCDSLKVLADYLTASRLDEQAEKYYVKQYDYSVKFLEEYPDLEFDNFFTSACHSLGGITLNNGELDRAEELFRKEIDFRRDRVTYPVDFKTAWDVYAGFDGLGNIEIARGDLDKAEQYFVEGMRISGKLMEDTDSFNAKRGFATVYERLAAVCMEQKTYAIADYYFSKAYDIRIDLAKQYPAVWAARDLAELYGKMADLAGAQGETEKKEDLLETSHRIYSQITESVPQEDVGRRQMENSGELAAAAMESGDFASAVKYFREAAELADELLSEVIREEDADSSVNYRHGLCDALIAQGDWDRAYNETVRSLSNARKLAEAADTAATHCAVAYAYYQLANISMQKHEPAKIAMGFSEKGLSHIRDYYGRDQSASVRRAVMAGCDSAGTLAHTAGDRSTELRCFREMADICEELAGSENTAQSRDDLAVAYYKLGVCTRDAEYFDKAIEIYRELANSEPGDTEYRYRAQVLEAEKSRFAGSREKRSIFDIFRKK